MKDFGSVFLFVFVILMSLLCVVGCFIMGFQTVATLSGFSCVKLFGIVVFLSLMISGFACRKG